MKYILSILIFVSLLLASCQQKEKTSAELIKEKKALLKTKRGEFRELKTIIKKIETELDSLDPKFKKEKPRTLVTTEVIRPTNFDRFIELQSAIEGEDMVAASSETGGRIISLNVKEGQYVKKGQLVATIDLEAINKQIAELEKTLELADDVFQRQKRLWEQNIGSEIQFLKAKNDKERLEKSLETIRYQLTKGNVYAPISGTVEMVISKNGEMAGPGTPIIQILNTNKVKVVANVPEKFLREVRKGQMMTIHIPALDIETKGRVSMISSSINPANRTFKVEVNLANPKGLLKPNLLANMLLNDFSAKDVIVLPVELVQQEVSGKDYVFVKKEGAEGAMAEKKYVVTGESYDGKIIIKEGVKAGEELIVSGARGLANHGLIKVK